MFAVDKLKLQDAGSVEGGGSSSGDGAGGKTAGRELPGAQQQSAVPKYLLSFPPLWLLAWKLPSSNFALSGCAGKRKLNSEVRQAHIQAEIT